MTSLYFLTALTHFASAEEKILEYIKRVHSHPHFPIHYVHPLVKMNRPYGAVDVAANLKGAVQKSVVQKILVTLAEKGELVQKTYGMPFAHILSPTCVHISYTCRQGNIICRQSSQHPNVAT